MRMSSAITALKTKAPSLGGSFAVWGGLYSSFDCTFAYLRGKEDFKNSIMSGAATGAVLAARSTYYTRSIPLSPYRSLARLHFAQDLSRYSLIIR
jgi:hypothetical protein